MATKYRIYKQLTPASVEKGDPVWARKQIWVQKLNDQDTIDEFHTRSEAEAFKADLESNDPTGRQYKIEETTID